MTPRYIRNRDPQAQPGPIVGHDAEFQRFLRLRRGVSDMIHTQQLRSPEFGTFAICAAVSLLAAVFAVATYWGARL